MNEWDVFKVIVALVGFITTVFTMFYKPVQALTTEIKVLNTNFENSKEQDRKRDDRLDSHSKRIDEVQSKVSDHDKRLSVLERIKQ